MNCNTFVTIHNFRLPQTKYKETWDVNCVLICFENKTSNSLDLGPLARKLATLLALATLCRVLDLQEINFSTIPITNNDLSFSLSRQEKPKNQECCIHLQSSGYLISHPIRCTVQKNCVNLCKTYPFRIKSNGFSLFIGSVKPHRQIKSTTIAGWMKSQLSDAGIDISKFSAHSTKSAGDSKAVESEAPLSSILYAGH